jgi:GNAT superfamily N-acetyltransferase
VNVSVDFLSSGEVGAAAAVLGAAFVDNPNSLAIWRRQGPTEARKQAAVFRLLKLDRPYSKVLVARVGDEVVGVLNMAPWPQCQIKGPAMAGLIPRLILITGSGVLRGVMGRAAQLQAEWGRYDPERPHWHLGPVGVLPNQQGRGVGTALMDRFCELVDEDSIGSYLETDRPENVPFYERFAFQVSNETMINGVTNWLMWREPASAPQGRESV